jgi:glucokinase
MSAHKKKYTIGIDVGGTKILAAVLDGAFRIQSEIKMKTRPEKGLSKFLEDLHDCVRQVIAEAKIKRSTILGVGIGCPGMIDAERGIIASSPNIPFLRNLPLARLLARRIGLPVTLCNDVQTGLYGEHQFGAVKGYANAVGIFMGTGIGGALVLNNQLFRGATGSAGEVGHIMVDPEGPVCGCGHRGCLEALAGRLAIAAEAALAVARQKAPHLADKTGTDIRQIKSGAMAKAIKAGDRAIEDLIRRKARLVGQVMANLVNIINPDVIVLGGGVVEAMGGIILREAERAMRERSIGASSRHVKVVAAKLKDYSIVMGAAKQAADAFGAQKQSHG